MQLENIMKNFGDMKVEVANYCKLPTDQEALGIAGSGIVDSINNVINSRSWSWQLVSYNFPLEANDNTYLVPTDFRESRNLSLLNTAGEVAHTVGYDDPKFHDRLYQRGTSSSTANGIPGNYTITDLYPSGMIRFDRTPDASVIETYPSGQLLYYARVTEPTVDTDVLNVPPEAESLILWMAKSYLASIFAQDQVKFAEARWQPLYNQLKRNDRQTRDWSTRNRR